MGGYITMKKLSLVLMCTFALGLIVENTYARSLSFCNFRLEHDNPSGLSERLKTVDDELTVTPAKTLTVDSSSPGLSASIPLSDFIDEDTGSKNLDLFDVDLKQFSEKMESFGLSLKMSKADLVCKERNDYYFTGLNYSLALSYKF
jgi:hypothetical protein